MQDLTHLNQEQRREIIEQEFDNVVERIKLIEQADAKAGKHLRVIWRGLVDVREYKGQVEDRLAMRNDIRHTLAFFDRLLDLVQQKA